MGFRGSGGCNSWHLGLEVAVRGLTEQLRVRGQGADVMLVWSVKEIPHRIWKGRVQT